MYEEQENRSAYKEYLCTQINNTWNTFEKDFLKLWDTNENGNLYPNTMMNKDNKNKFKSEFMNDIFNDTILYACICMIRRCIGIADSPVYRIKNFDKRCIAEQKVISFTYDIMLNIPKNIQGFTQKILDLYFIDL